MKAEQEGLRGRELTIRAIATGIVLGMVLTPCNIYSGLMIGWSFNMSIVAALVSFGFWQALHGMGWGRRWGLLENNINQTTTSSAASIISSGLVAPIPALALLTGRELPLGQLIFWLLAVSFLGVFVAIAMRAQLIVREDLPFPAGIATAETVREIYAHGRDAMIRVAYLLGAGMVAFGAKTAALLTAATSWAPAWVLARTGARGLTASNLTFALDPSLLLIGFGMIIGPRVAFSVALGAIVAWWVLLPRIVDGQWVTFPEEFDWSGSLYGKGFDWLLWPGVSLMVVAALATFVLQVGGTGLSYFRRKPSSQEAGQPEEGLVPRKWFWSGLAAAFVLAVAAQIILFDIRVPMAALAVALTFVLAIVAGRSVGETGIPPIGAVGKVTQVTFGLLNPGNPTTNLMTANVTGGAAGQCGDMLNDLKTGRILGATAWKQTVAQFFGVMTGSVAGAAAYIAIIRDPSETLEAPPGEEPMFPAPAVHAWKAVAEVLRDGAEALPAYALEASATGACVGLALALAEHFLPKRHARFVPSPIALGLGFVLPASNAISFVIGALAAIVAGLVSKSWRLKFIIAIAAGLIAGESIAGVLNSFYLILVQ